MSFETARERVANYGDVSLGHNGTWLSRLAWCRVEERSGSGSMRGGTLFCKSWRCAMNNNNGGNWNGGTHARYPICRDLNKSAVAPKTHPDWHAQKRFCFTGIYRTLSSGPPNVCHHCGQTLTIDHMLLECAVLQECRDEYYTADSLNTVFETIPETCIVEFLRQVVFFYLIWTVRHPIPLLIWTTPDDLMQFSNFN